MRARTIDGPYGRVHLRTESSQLTRVSADSDCGAYFGQGYVAGRERLWQLELTRRVAVGTTAEIFGARSLAADRFQRNLGLEELAAREMEIDRGSLQAAHVRAYVRGVNRAVEAAKVPPIELLLLGIGARPFSIQDAYLVGQLKYFINSTWKFELLFTLVAGELPWPRLQQLFAIHSLEGDRLPPLPHPTTGIDPSVATVLRSGLEGLDRLGLSSPDIGSNGFAVAGCRSASGRPILATDPHMGTVNPGFNMLFHLESGEGLDVVGSHFPGVPGIVIGRNRSLAWGMVGMMADNQDLLWGRVDLDEGVVFASEGPRELECEDCSISVRGERAAPHRSYRFGGGRLLCRRGDHALFLRWPALERRLGSITFHEICRARDWSSFRAGLREVHNAPMMAVYADRDDTVALQTVGLIPRRGQPVGSIVLSLESPESDWQGYVPFDELPRLVDPPEGFVVYANEYSSRLFARAPPLSNRWHPPTRALRIRERILAEERHSAGSLAAIQDDLLDTFARDQLAWIRRRLRDDSVLAGWDGDTRDVRAALRFERLVSSVAAEVLRELPAELASGYVDQWPMHRWNLMTIVRDHAGEWRLDVDALLERALESSRLVGRIPRVTYRHALRRLPGAGRLFAVGHRYDGGSRETVHVARRRADYLSAGQGGAGGPRQESAFSFGPSFKLVFELAARGESLYLANMPTAGRPFGLDVWRTMRRWRRRRRQRLVMS